MNRRGFFGFFAGATAAAIALPDLGLLVPKRTIFLPPAGGWRRGNTIFTAQQLYEEMLQIMYETDAFAIDLNREYELGIDPDYDQKTRHIEWATVDVKHPPRYDICVGDRITIEGVKRA